MGIEPTNKGFADLCLTTWLPRLSNLLFPAVRSRFCRSATRSGFAYPAPLKTKALIPIGLGPTPGENGAGDGIRTRDIDLGKVALYQLSYSRFNPLILSRT